MSRISERGRAAGIEAATVSAPRRDDVLPDLTYHARMQLAVLGGSGSLGGAVTAKAIAAGHHVVAISRSVPKLLPDKATHAKADVTTGEGLAQAFAGCDAIIDGTNAMANAKEVLVDGTRRVLEAAKAAGVGHFVGISIVGIDTAPLAYYKTKVAQEKVIEGSPIPWTLLRATQFHDLIPRFVQGKLGVLFAPRGWKLQPIEVGEVAAELIALAAKPAAKRVPDIGGPEVLELAELARKWKRARGKPRLILRVPVPGATGRFLRSGAMCCPDRAVGKITFDAWLARQRWTTSI